MQRMRIVAALAIVLIAASGAEAKWLRGKSNPTPGVLPGTAGMRSWAGVTGLGGPETPTRWKAGTQPVIGSVTRTGHFVHPISGRTKYSGTAYDPIQGRFSQYSFRQ